ncbi:MAG: hypothetical protein Q8P18_33840 [Pseudomonadota bacterium]|nr:hypothetical protein [Pseudomonadota bacterium]
MRLRFDTVGCGTMTQALAVLNEGHPPDAIVLTLRQADDNGLVAGKALRALVGPDVYILVHGAADMRPGARRPAASERQGIATWHGVNGWSEAVLEPEAIESVVGGELHRRHRAQVPVAAPVSLLTRARAVTREDMKAFLTKDRPLVPTPPRAPDEPPGWIELLNAAPTAANLKALLTKEIGGMPRRSEG